MEWIGWIGWICLGITLLRLIVSLINTWSTIDLNTTPPPMEKRVSILIPARNEARNLGTLLNSLIQQTYRHLEIIVYDDESTDQTPQIINHYRNKDARISLIKGQALPHGWTGKNHACYRLGQQARGDYLLFLDADVWLRNNAIHQALYHMETHSLDLLSIFPTQITKTWGEHLTVPLLPYVLLSFLPLITVKKAKSPFLAAAVGQFMMFNAQHYHQHQWHKQVYNHITEDLSISRLMKSGGYKTSIILGKDHIFCRMYRNYREGLQGFSKNIRQALMNNSILLTGLLIYLVFGGLLITLSLPLPFLFLYLGIIGLIKTLTAKLSRQPVIMNILLHLPQIITLFVIGMMAFRNKKRNGYLWKGRIISHDSR